MTVKTLLSLFAVSVLFCASCKKKYTCHCCGGFAGSCWDETIKVKSDKGGQAACMEYAEGSDFACELK